jgi:hypothetical protein
MSLSFGSLGVFAAVPAPVETAACPDVMAVTRGTGRRSSASAAGDAPLSAVDRALTS